MVIGARSAVFAPVRGLGLICVDEEHDASYKQESDPRYDARTVAAKRASLEGAVAVYGSATPRPESWARLERLELGGRIGAPLPAVRVVDLRHERGYPLSAPLLASSGRWRPRAAGRSCSSTGAASRPRSTAGRAGRRSAARTATSRWSCTRTGRLRCHHCGVTEPAPEACPPAARPSSRGSERGRSASSGSSSRPVPRARAFPARRRHGRRSRGGRRGRFAVRRSRPRRPRRHADGGEGSPLRRVSLAAVVDADTGLGLPDFRAEERTFQLLTQLAGRSGRDAPGRVLVQTFQPEARAIALAARHDVAGFLAGSSSAAGSSAIRRLRHLVRILVSGPDRDDAMQALTELAARMADAPGELLGPGPAVPASRAPSRAARRQDRPPARGCVRAGRLLAAAARPCAKQSCRQWSTSTPRASD